MTGGDTIVAPATPLGRSALAVVRLDGAGAAEILTRLSRRQLPPVRMATLTPLWVDGLGGPELLDEAIVVRFEAPHSFTGNDLVEVSLHGNPVLVRRLLDACLGLGARLAEPGEFSERAVLNGKLDLVQAESVADLINARTALQARLSLSNLEGTLSRRAAGIRATLLDVISRLEGALDFSEEGYEFIGRLEVIEQLERCLTDVEAMVATYDRGHATQEGLEAVILGRPNAGKSTLLNRLVGSDRAIVTPIPGTTRDIVRETIEIGGLPVTLADTAGLREGGDAVETMGMERARAAARRAEIVLYLIDSTKGFGEEDRREAGALANVLLVYTKCDLARAPEGALAISAATGEGIESLLQRLDELVKDRYVAPEGALVNQRQRLAVAECAASLSGACESARSGLDEQIILVDLYRAANALGVLTGAITREDVLAEIFGKFCIGK